MGHLGRVGRLFLTLFRIAFRIFAAFGRNSLYAIVLKKGVPVVPPVPFDRLAREAVPGVPES